MFSIRRDPKHADGPLDILDFVFSEIPKDDR